MATLEWYLQGVAAVMTATFALALLAGRPVRAATGFLVAFLLLIAGNQAIEVSGNVALSRGGPNFLDRAEGSLTVGPVVVGEATVVNWYELAQVLAAADPFVLYYFVSVFPRRNALNATWKVSLVGGGSLASVAATIAWGRADIYDLAPARAAAVALSAFTTLVYTVAFLHVARTLRAAPRDPALRLLFPAFALAALPAWVRLGAGGIPLAVGRGIDPWTLPVALLALLAGASVAAAIGWRVLRAVGEAPPARRLAAATGAATAVVAVAFLPPAVEFLVGSLAGGRRADLQFLHPLAVAARWVSFGLLVSMAVVRHRLLDVGIVARVRAARLLGGAIFLAGIVGLLLAESALFEPATRLFSAGEALVLLVALVASRWFERGVGSISRVAYGVPAAGDLAGRLDAYRAAVEEARDGPRPDAAERLDALRRELGLDAKSARVVERMAAGADGGPLVPGRVAAGRYRVTRLLGRGASGRVFLARDELIERDVALKEVGHAGDADESVALAEARLAGGLAHPNVVTVLDVVRTPTSSLIVSEYVPGGSLADRVARDGVLAPEAGLRVLDGLLAGLAAAHRRGIVHRDVKPANVLLADADHPKLADFGVARVRRGSTARLGEGAGTPGFMAPEIARGAPATEASDVYAVGLLARRCVGGPLPPAVDAVLARALDEEPSRRWPDAGAMRDALRHAARRRGGA